jgi:hypothetical protein
MKSQVKYSETQLTQNTSVCWSRYVEKFSGNSGHDNGNFFPQNDVHNIDKHGKRFL